LAKGLRLRSDPQCVRVQVVALAVLPVLRLTGGYRWVTTDSRVITARFAGVLEVGDVDVGAVGADRHPCRVTEADDVDDAALGGVDHPHRSSVVFSVT